MATQYTSLLGLALPVTGELSGTWGDTVNDAITSLLDSAVAGTTTLNTDADVTLTTTTGAANQARQAIILWTANGTTTRNITAPAQSKIYTVINASAGTQSIVFRGVGPTAGVTVVKGESAVVAWNGSDFIKISNTGGGGSFTNVTISGTTTLSGLTASTALALNASKEVVSVTNTGTGDNVLATSPVLTTPNLGTPSAVTLTNATGLPVSTGISGLGTGVATALAVNTGTAGAFVVNGGALGTPSSGTVTNLTGTASININGTVGATTPNTGAFTTLTTSSTVTLNGGTANGVAYLNGSKVLTTGSALTYNGSQLKVSGLFYTNSDTDYLKMVNAADTTYWGRISQNGSDIEFYNRQAGALKFGVSDAEQMRLTSTGLGIGTSSPGVKLDVSGPNGNFIRYTSTGGVSAILGDSSGNVGQTGTTTNHPFLFLTNAAERMRLDTSGNLGLGVTPSAWNSSFRAMQLGNSGYLFGRASQTQMEMGNNAVFDATDTRWEYITTNTAQRYLQDGTSGSHQWFTAPSGTAGNAISFSQVMTLDSSGNLGIGTSSPASYNAGGNSLVVGGSGNYKGMTIASAVEGNIYFADGTSGTETYRGIVGYNHTSDFMAFYTSANERARIDSAGNLGLGVTPSAWSLSGLQAMQIKNAGVHGYLNEVGVEVNAYYSGSWKYISNGYASQHLQVSGQHRWLTAPSGTAGNAISFSQVMTLDADGDLGLGTTSPSVSDFTGGALGMHIKGSSNYGILKLESSDNKITWLATGSAATYLYVKDANPLVFGTNNTERARITSGGDLLVGKTTLSGTTVGFQFKSTGEMNSGMAASTNSDSTLSVYSTGASAYRFYVGLGGTVYATSTTISAISDIRFKENVRDLDAGLAEVMALKPRLYDWKEGKGANIKNARGFIAQEFEQVFPDLIDEWKDPAPEGEDPYKSVRQDLIPVLVKAIQEQQAIITDLRARVAALEAA